MAHILFILSGNISTTPRAVKNIHTANQHHQVTILKTNRHPAWDALDAQWQKAHALPVHSVSLGRKPFIPWLWASLCHQLARWLYPLFPRCTRINALASQKINSLLAQAALKHAPPVDWVIGQGGGALYPAYAFARKRGIPFAFDVEDYHPGEHMHDPRGYEQKRRAFLLRTLLPKARYISYASPLIGEYTLRLLHAGPPAHFLLNNSFPAAEFPPPQPPTDERVHLVWFSQNIDYGRGLEQIIPAVARLKAKVHLTLIGQPRAGFNEEWLLPHADCISIVHPMPQEQLHSTLSGFDAGLAIELGTVDFNRQICWTNKLFAYAQAGLYIVATDTQGQQLFMQQHPDLGQVCKQRPADFVQVLGEVVAQRSHIRQQAQGRYQYAKKLAWEHEAGKLVKIWNEGIIGTKPKISAPG